MQQAACTRPYLDTGNSVRPCATFRVSPILYPAAAGCAAVLCPAIYAPVCGANNFTYPNSCQAACTGVTIVANTTCDATVNVKGGGSSNSNGGGAAGGGVRGGGNGHNGNGHGNNGNNGHNGNNEDSPEQGCVCPFIYQPVCGANNVTYGNACEAACAGIAVQYIGQCADEGEWLASCCRTTSRYVA